MGSISAFTEGLTSPFKSLDFQKHRAQSFGQLVSRGAIVVAAAVVASGVAMGVFAALAAAGVGTTAFAATAAFLVASPPGLIIVTSVVTVVALGILLATGIHLIRQQGQQDVKQIIKNTPPIASDFTTKTSRCDQIKAHETAKQFLEDNLPKTGATVQFISHCKQTAPKLLSTVHIDTAQLDKNVFQVGYTIGATADICKDGKRTEDNVIVYGVASQFNWGESATKTTISPGQAVEKYKFDPTQGPACQLAFPEDQVELINCAANIGSNGLCYALVSPNHTQVAHGYFTPDETHADKVIVDLQENGAIIEYPCIANKPLQGSKVVHQILVAGPAFGEYETFSTVKGEKRNEIEFLCALHGFRAQFELCVDLAKENKQPVILKAAAVGVSAYGNNPVNVAKAFYQAATEYQDALKGRRVTVQFQIFKNYRGVADPKATQIAKELGLVL